MIDQSELDRFSIMNVEFHRLTSAERKAWLDSWGRRVVNNMLDMGFMEFSAVARGRPYHLHISSEGGKVRMAITEQGDYGRDVVEELVVPRRLLSSQQELL